ncbi:MAG: hypothetical protein WBO44_09915 [Saprospiraceae bacterium]
MAKSEKAFDQNIKDILESYSTNTQPDWDFMQQKMDAADRDLEFDQKIKQSFQNLELDSEQINWQHFVAKKNRMLERRRHIIRARMIESLLFLLLLWTLDNIGITNILPIKEKQAELVAPIAQNKTESIQTNLELNAANENYSTTTQSTSKENKSTAHLQSYDVEHSKGLIPIAGRKKQQTNQLSSNSIPAASNASMSASINLKESIEYNQNSSASSLENNQEASAIALQNPAAILENIEYLPVLQAGLPQNLDAIVLTDLPQVLNALPNKIIPVALKSTWLMMHTGLMLNTIQSPSFLDFGKTYQHQLRPGIQTALSFGVEAKKWMIESGLIYSHLSYQPNMSETLGSFENGYYKIRFDKIQSHILSIPVLLHRQVVQRNHWSVSAKLGLSISAALKNYFTLDTITNLSGTVHQGIAYGTKDNSVLSTRVRNDSNQGLLDGGTFGVNSFANVVTGIRVNHQLNSKLNLYSEIELNAMLGPKKIGDTPNGFGPNADRIIATNFNVGLAFKLK